MDDCYLNTECGVLETSCSCKAEAGKAYVTPQPEVLNMAVTVVNAAINNLPVNLLRAQCLRVNQKSGGLTYLLLFNCFLDVCGILPEATARWLPVSVLSTVLSPNPFDTCLRTVYSKEGIKSNSRG